MDDPRSVIERGLAHVGSESYTLESFYRRRDRKRRNERIAAGAVALAITIAIVVATIAIDPRDTTVPAKPLRHNGDITFVGLSEFSDMATIYTVDPTGGAPTKLLDLDPDCSSGPDRCDMNDPWIRSVDWSPDGTRIAYAIYDWGGSTAGIYVMDVATGQIQRVTRCALPCVRQDDIEWSPDGSRITYTQMDHDFCNGPNGGFSSCSIYTVGADGTDPTRLSTGSVVDPVNPSWSPDGTAIAFSGRVSEEGKDWFVYTMVLDGSEPSRLASDLPAPRQNKPAWSPDGSAIAFLADAGGTANEGWPYELWLVAPDGSERRLLTTGCCRVAGYGSRVSGIPVTAPEWSPDGTQILIHDGGLVYVHDGSFISPVIVDATTGERVVIDVEAGGAVAWQPVP
jgi:Tol biopolymer transport system component